MPHRRTAPLTALTALLALSLGACKVSGELKLGGTADADATTTPPAATTPTPAGPPGGAVHIVRRGDRLIYENGEIEFATNSDILRGASTEQVLDEFAAVLKRYPALKVRVEGHTDSRGSTSANQKLSQKRADSIQRALVQRGVAKERLSPVGHGENKPTRPEPLICHNRSEDTVPVDRLSECHATWRHNRRAVFVVTEGADTLPTEGSSVSHPAAAPGEAPAPVVATSAHKRRPDWALRMFGGYSTLPLDRYHGGHLGVGLHASIRFGQRQRGYLGGGPRLHYRGLRFHDSDGTGSSETTLAIHQFGPEGNFLIGGGKNVLLIDLGLPDISGIEVIRHANQTLPKCECMVVTVFGDERHVLESIEAGATGYLAEEMVTGIVGEILLGLRRDPVYGVTLTLGMGGVTAEVLADTVTLANFRLTSSTALSAGRLRTSSTVSGTVGSTALAGGTVVYWPAALVRHHHRADHAALVDQLHGLEAVARFSHHVQLGPDLGQARAQLVAHQPLVVGQHGARAGRAAGGGWRCGLCAVRPCHGWLREGHPGGCSAGIDFAGLVLGPAALAGAGLHPRLAADRLGAAYLFWQCQQLQRRHDRSPGPDADGYGTVAGIQEPVAEIP